MRRGRKRRYLHLARQWRWNVQCDGAPRRRATGIQHRVVGGERFQQRRDSGFRGQCPGRQYGGGCARHWRREVPITPRLFRGESSRGDCGRRFQPRWVSGSGGDEPVLTQLLGTAGPRRRDLRAGTEPRHRARFARAHGGRLQRRRLPRRGGGDRSKHGGSPRHGCFWGMATGHFSRRLAFPAESTIHPK